MALPETGYSAEGTESTTDKHILSINERVKRINNFAEKQKKYIGTIIEDGGDLGALIYLHYYEATKNIASTAKEADLKEVIKELDRADINHKMAIMTFLGCAKHKLAEKTLLELMNDENELIRNQAIGALIISGNRDENVVEKAVEVQKVRLKSKDEKERLGAVSMLREIGGKKAAAALLLAINDAEHDVEQQALYALKVLRENNIAKDIISYLTNKKDSQKGANAAVIQILGEIGSEEAVPILIQILQNDTYGPRQLAAKALGKIGDEKAIPFLIKALNDENEEVRIYAAQSLGLLGNKEGYEIAMKYISDENWMVRTEVVKALECIGGEKALLILEGMKKKEGWGTGTYQEICKAIISIKSKNVKYVGNTKIDRDFEEIIASLNSGLYLLDKDLQKKIKKITSMEVKDILIKMIEDFKGHEGPDRDLRESAISLLGEVEGEVAYPVVFKLLKDENGAIRRRAIITLQRLNYRKEEILQEIVANETDDILLGDAIQYGLGIGNDKILQSLMKIVETENYHHSKAMALEALSIIAEEKILIPILKKNISNVDPYLQERAKSLLDLF